MMLPPPPIDEVSIATIRTLSMDAVQKAGSGHPGTFEGAGDFAAATPGGRNFHFGVREHAMSSILNGLSLAKIRPYGSGFLIFSDYARPAIRLSALMELPAIYIFTHDSIGVGEDGPTHQPVEQLASLRAIPGLITLRPADANEIAEAWRVVIESRRSRSFSRGSRFRRSTAPVLRPPPGSRGAATFSRTPRTARPR